MSHLTTGLVHPAPAGPRLADLAELVRLPAALTVPGDTLAGAAAAGVPGARSLSTPLASVCLYWAGMALNDYADRELDRTERPERPIPSGRVRPRQALAVAGVLSATGVGLASLSGRSAAATATVLAGVVWSYDLALKRGPLGPAAMAAARGLDVVLGAAGQGARPRAALAPAALMAAHTAAVTVLSRGEVHGASPAAGRAALATTVGTAVAATTLGGRRALPAALAATYAAGVGRGQAAAAASPDAGTVRRATGAGIRGMIPLQASLVAGRGAPRTALALLAVGPLVRAASKVVSPT
ncbi:SCO3242 family prenyltransferase [Nocardioides donggukensis]|uniref:UbiA family prenyltransferase n=1 Tax=Nocardioides donggukensis TaxID=2774019 RepID=A0A927KAH6_9ACTN|nr:UbiA family prenyltransferase [Nocardioides donggukensis]MBD8870640.1 UbiA family prenyltransferase [Nocardioides donggukensis]